MIIKIFRGFHSIFQTSGSDTLLLDEDNAILKYGHQFADYLAKGMGDNWSQVSCLCLYLKCP